MNKIVIGTTAALTAALMPPLGAVTAAVHHPRSAGINTPGLPNPYRGHPRPLNWSGSVAQGGKYHSISAWWTQPFVQRAFADHLAAFWVGLDGYDSKTVEQVGTAAEAVNGHTHYAAWWQMCPSNAMQFFSNPVRPGDHLKGTVTYRHGRYVLKITDTTRRWTRSVAKYGSYARSSAEVIAEAPASVNSGRLFPLPNFGRVTFHAIKVNGSTPRNAFPLTMVTRSGLTKVSVSHFTGRSFSATWRRLPRPTSSRAGLCEICPSLRWQSSRMTPRRSGDARPTRFCNGPLGR